MQKEIKILDNLKIVQKQKDDISEIYIIDNNEIINLSEEKVNKEYWNGYAYNDKYIVSYTTGCLTNLIPLTINKVYSIENHELVDISCHKVEQLFEFMLIYAKFFNIACILSALNDIDLGLIDEKEKSKLISYLASGNKDISNDEIKRYIIKTYPILEKYMHLNQPLTDIEYQKICDSIGTKYLSFHRMTQNIDYLNKVTLEEKENDIKLQKLYKREFNK